MKGDGSAETPLGCFYRRCSSVFICGCLVARGRVSQYQQGAAGDEGGDHEEVEAGHEKGEECSAAEGARHRPLGEEPLPPLAEGETAAVEGVAGVLQRQEERRDGDEKGRG